MDTIERVNLDNTREAAIVMATFAYQAANLDRKLPRDPVCPIYLEFIANQIVHVADDYAIRFGVDVDHVTRPERSAGKTFTLANREELDSIVLGDEISLNIVNLSALKFVFAKVRAQERFVVVSRHETNFLTVDLIRHFQT